MIVAFKSGHSCCRVGAHIPEQTNVIGGLVERLHPWI